MGSLRADSVGQGSARAFKHKARRGKSQPNKVEEKKKLLFRRGRGVEE